MNYKPQHNAPGANTGQGAGCAGPPMGMERFANQEAAIPFAPPMPCGHGGGYHGPTHQAFLVTNDPSASNGMTHQP